MDKNTQMEKLFTLANEAKDVREYALANTIFAFLISESTQLEGSWMTFEDPFRLQWETADEEGRTPSEVYYDLVGLEFGEHYLCLPAPLLKRDVAISVLKRAEIVERDRHERSTRKIVEGELELLWKEFEDLLRLQLLIAPIAVRSFLENSEEVEARLREMTGITKLESDERQGALAGI